MILNFVYNESETTIRAYIANKELRTLKHMISFEEFKISLGALANELSDEQIEGVRCAFDKIADIAFDSMRAKKNINYQQESV